MTHEELSKTLLPLLGGKENIIAVANCMTRLRLTLVDLRKVDSRVLKQTEGVLGIVEDLNFQIIIGPGKAQKYAKPSKSSSKSRGGSPIKPPLPNQTTIGKPTKTPSKLDKTLQNA